MTHDSCELKVTASLFSFCNKTQLILIAICGGQFLNGGFPNLLFHPLHVALGYVTMNEPINYFPLTQNSVIY